jgi:hypothetical protein
LVLVLVNRDNDVVAACGRRMMALQSLCWKRDFSSGLLDKLLFLLRLTLSSLHENNEIHTDSHYMFHELKVRYRPHLHCRCSRPLYAPTYVWFLEHLLLQL